MVARSRSLGLHYWRVSRTCNGKGARVASALKALSRLISPAAYIVTALASGWFPANSQALLKPAADGEMVNLLPSDQAVLESGEARRDLPCMVIQRKADLGFDLRFHSGYDVTIPLREVSGNGGVLTVVFRVFSESGKDHPSYFTQHIRVPDVEEEAKGDAALGGGLDLGPGKFHVDWLMRDRMERVCSSSWDVEATLPPKDKTMTLFIQPDEIAQSAPEPFLNDGPHRPPATGDALNVKLLVNFAPQNATSASMGRSDTEALVSILKFIERDPHVNRVSLVAFNIGEGRVLYRQEAASAIDFPALGKAIQTMKLGTVDVAKLSDKHSETGFLEQLIQTEVGGKREPDAVIFAGPKAMLDADVPQEELRRIGEVECPVFYMNYNLNPRAVPWKDSISHAIKAFKGTEFTISRPRDLWLTTSDMVGRIVRSKKQHNVTSTALLGTGTH